MKHQIQNFIEFYIYDSYFYLHSTHLVKRITLMHVFAYEVRSIEYIESLFNCTL